MSFQRATICGAGALAVDTPSMHMGAHMIWSSIALALAVLVFCLVGLQTSSAQAASIAWELERGFRFFKFNSDFEFQRLASRDFQAKNSNKQPTIVEVDALLDNRDWWDEFVDPKLAAWYGHASPVTPLDLLREWRAEEIVRGRAPGYLELSLKLKAEHRFYWEYHPVRLGWSSLLFPAHQTPEDIGKSQLIDASQVAVCWNREAQRHTNCDQLDPYVVPLQHTVSVRAVDDSGRRILTGNCLWIIEATSGARFVLPRDTEVDRLQIECKEKVAISVPYRHETTLRLTVNDAEVGTVIKVEDVLIVGLGDSFSSGEGNPDVPVKLAWSPDQNVDPITAGNDPVDQVSGGPVRKRAGDYFAAQWIDRSCHRSAYSYQLRSALHLAVSEPHRAITFLGYACSGAEVNEGLFHPHQGPEYTTNKKQMPPWQRSQLPLLLSELCEEYNGRAVRNKPLTPRRSRRPFLLNQYKLGGVIRKRPIAAQASRQSRDLREKST